MVLAAAIVVCLSAAAATLALSGSGSPAAAAPAPTGTAAPSVVSSSRTAVSSAAATAAKPARTPVPHAISVPAGAVQSEPAESLPNASGPGYGGPSPSQTIAEVLPNTTAFQRALLADGELTRDEYETAVFAAVQCIADHGFVVAGPSTTTWVISNTSSRRRTRPWARSMASFRTRAPVSTHETSPWFGRCPAVQ